jgi:hypothetical protein
VSKVVVGHPQKHGKNAAFQAARKIQFFPSKFHHRKFRLLGSDGKRAGAGTDTAAQIGSTQAAHIIKIKLSAKSS